MPQPYSVDLRARVVRAAASQTQADVAARFAVSASTVYKWCRRAREAGTVAPKPHTGGGHSRVDAVGAERLGAWLREQSDRTLTELQALYGAQFDVRPSRSALSRAVLRLGLRRKKRR
jgi:transposase